MKSKFGALALTGMLALAACGQPQPGPTTNPTTTNPTTTNPTTTNPTTTNPTTTNPTTTNPTTTNPTTTNPTTTNPTTTNPTTTNPTLGSIVITSPTNGQTITTGTTVVNFTASNVTNITCSVAGGTPVAAQFPGSGAGACSVDFGTTANGPVTITVSGTGPNGAVTSTVTVNLQRPAAANGTVTFGPIMTPGANGRIDYTQFRDGGARRIAQLNLPAGVTGSIPSEVTQGVQYVKGRVTISFAAAANVTRVEAYVSGTIDGAILGGQNYLYDGVPNPASPIVFDTSVLNTDQSKVLYLVVRSTLAGGVQQVTSTPFIVDNSGPQPADPEFEAAQGVGNNLLRDYGAPNRNFVRGAFQVFTSNPNIIDQFVNTAATPPQILPSGIDFVTYYFVPTDQLPNITPVQGQQRVLDIIANARYNTGPVEAAGVPNPQNNNLRDYRALFDSRGKTDGNYAIFTVTTDQLGNESASTTYENLFFDNTGPTAAGLTVVDASPLPFPSADPTRYISDLFRIAGSITDAGVGLAGFDPSAIPGFGTIGINFCGRVTSVPAAFSAIGGGSTVTIDSTTLLDSNTIVPADGLCTVTIAGEDALGNTGDGSAIGQRVVFDNTDPNADILRPNEGVSFLSGDTVPVDSNASDITSSVDPRPGGSSSATPTQLPTGGLNPSFTKLFWTDYIEGQVRTRSRTNGYIAYPVEFRTDPIRPGAVSGGWKALYPGLPGADLPSSTPRPMQLGVLAVDNAGNATIKLIRVNVSLDRPANPGVPPLDGGAQVSGEPIYALPKLGDFDVYQRNTVDIPGQAPAYSPVPLTDATHVVPVAGPANTTDPNLTFETVGDVLRNGTFSRAGNAVANDQNPFNKIDRVEYYRQLLPSSWVEIVQYQLGTAPVAPGQDPRTVNDPTLVARPGSDLATRRITFRRASEINEANILPAPGGAPWFLIGDTNTSSDFYRAIFTATGANAFGGVSAIAAYLQDNSGQYQAVAEGFNDILIQNQISQALLTAPYTAPGSVVNPIPFVVTTPFAATLLPTDQPAATDVQLTSASQGFAAPRYFLQARDPSDPNTFITIPLSTAQGVPTGRVNLTGNDRAAFGTVLFTTDNGSNANATVTTGINQVFARYTFGTTKFREFRLVTVAGGNQINVGQVFTLSNVQ